MNIQVNDESYATIKELSAKAGVSIEEYMNKLVFYARCDEAKKRYDETGLHLTHEEVMNWLESWGTENELPKPNCHK